MRELKSRYEAEKGDKKHGTQRQERNGKDDKRMGYGRQKGRLIWRLR